MEDSKLSGQTPTPSPDESGAQVKKDFKGLWISIRTLMSDLLDIRSNTDEQATKDAITADISFKGHTAWILVCSIFIASIGLNANSTAVVIGAMLISPLMGPILGMGMSLGHKRLGYPKKIAQEFGDNGIYKRCYLFLIFLLFPVANRILRIIGKDTARHSRCVDCFFWRLCPCHCPSQKGYDRQRYLWGRHCHSFDAAALYGWFWTGDRQYGICRRCSFCYWNQSIFIGLATFLVLKYLRFQMVRYANSKRRRMIARLVSLVAFAVMIPSGYIFYQVFQEFLFKKQANEFITNNVSSYKFPGEGRFLENITDLEYNKGENPYIELVFYGNQTIPDNVIATWTGQKNKYSKLRDTELRIIQGAKNEEMDQLKYVNELYESKKAELLNKDEKIRLLEAEVTNLNKLRKGQIPFKDISDEAKVNFQNLASLGYAREINTDFSKLDTLSIFDVRWKAGTTQKQIDEDSAKTDELAKDQDKGYDSADEGAKKSVTSPLCTSDALF